MSFRRLCGLLSSGFNLLRFHWPIDRDRNLSANRSGGTDSFWRYGAPEMPPLRRSFNANIEASYFRRVPQFPLSPRQSSNELAESENDRCRRLVAAPREFEMRLVCALHFTDEHFDNPGSQSVDERAQIRFRKDIKIDIKETGLVELAHPSGHRSRVGQTPAFRRFPSNERGPYPSPARTPPGRPVPTLPRDDDRS